MKIGVHNLYWTTFGGGEQQAGGVADALSAGHEVELLGPEALDLGRLRERLGLQLHDVTFRVVPPGDYSATLASADYELFINHTYRSTAPNLARHGVYFVMFPHVLDTRTGSQRLALAAGSRLASGVRLTGSLYLRRGGVRMVGPVLVQVSPGTRTVDIEFTGPAQSVYVAPTVPAAPVQVHTVGGVTRLHLEVGGSDIVVSPNELGAEVHFDEALRITGLWADGRRVANSPHSWQQRLTPIRPADFLKSYQHLVALSAYTQRWTKVRWGRDSEVLSPPVRLRTPGPDKERLILSVGRFFGEASGHSKRQLDLVRAFRRLVDEGLKGWRLVLMGGCAPDDREYAMAVRREVVGYPIEVRLSAPGAVLDEHLAKASIYWHATGYGTDLDAHPDRAEHFGIAPIEAMSAGAVPVVFDAAGPAEVVRDGVDGLVFRTIDQLVSLTRRLIEDEPYRRSLAVAAVSRSLEYGHDAFEQHVCELIERIAEGAPPAG